MRGARAAVKVIKTLTSLLFACSALASEPALPPAKSYGPFEMDASLEPRVKFWVDIYAKYHTWETLIVDLHYPQLVFSVVDARGKPGLVPSEKRRVSATMARLAVKWEQIQQGQLTRTALNPAERKFLEIFEREKLTSVLSEVAEDPRRLRAQAGLRDALEDALFVSGKYLPRMEALFERFHLPEEIAYLPFVESGFNKHAVSKVGASGIWQFMPYTGKLYLRVDDVVDERNDPMRAGEAAARLMKQNFELLGDWPLAITAYNHGTTGVAKAARDTGSRKISEIIEKYENKNFGFASQNFYACFLAALHVAKNSEVYLGIVPRAKKLEFDEFVMPDYMALTDFLAKMEIDDTIFRELNPALTEEVYSGTKYIPVGYTVRVPMESSPGFLGRYEAISATLKYRAQKNTGEAAVAPGSSVASLPAGAGPTH